MQLSPLLAALLLSCSGAGPARSGSSVGSIHSPPATTAPPSPSTALSVCHADTDAADRTLEGHLLKWLSRSPETPAGKARAALEVQCGTTPKEKAQLLRGDAAACTVLGVLLVAGDGVHPEPALAQRYFRRAAALGGFDLGGCELGANSSSQGIFEWSTACERVADGCPAGCGSACAERLEELRRQWIGPLEEACASDRGAACFLMGTAHAFGTFIDGTGQLVEQDAERAVDRLGRSCDLAVGPACGLAAELIEPLPEEANSEKQAQASMLWERGCKLGDGASCLALARRLAPLVPGSVPPTSSGDVERARVLFERACELGMVRVCQNLAELLEAGNSLPQDPAASDRLRRLGAEPWL